MEPFVINKFTNKEIRTAFLVALHKTGDIEREALGARIIGNLGSTEHFVILTTGESERTNIKMSKYITITAFQSKQLPLEVGTYCKLSFKRTIFIVVVVDPIAYNMIIDQVQKSNFTLTARNLVNIIIKTSEISPKDLLKYTCSPDFVPTPPIPVFND